MGTNTYLYRRGSVQDREQLKDLGIASYTEYASIFRADRAALLLRNLNDDNRLDEIISKAIIFVCELDGEIVGQAYLIPSGHPSEYFQNDWASIRMVGVHPAHRSQGIASKLTHMCIDHATRKGEKTIALHTSEVMPAAIHIYTSLGFVRVKEINHIYGVRYWVYTKAL